jgi:hypothetical protein
MSPPPKKKKKYKHQPFHGLVARELEREPLALLTVLAAARKGLAVPAGALGLFVAQREHVLEVRLPLVSGSGLPRRPLRRGKVLDLPDVALDHIVTDIALFLVAPPPDRLGAFPVRDGGLYII